jgi:hypothetical protein
MLSLMDMKKTKAKKKKSLSRHLVNRKNPLLSCSLSSSAKMGKKSFFIGCL